VRTSCLWVLMAIFFLFSNALATPFALECFGGVAEDGTYWYLLDYLGYPLEDGDWVYTAWVGPDGLIDPPGLDGWPMYDDEVLWWAGEPGGEIEYGEFFMVLTTWDIGDEDSLGYQRHPIAGDVVYSRIFDGPRGSIGSGNYYGDSQTYTCLHQLCELFFCLFPGDPGFGHTDTPVGPTAVELISFDAIARDGQVLLEWQTASELDNLGFHIERQEQRITETAIPAAGNSERGSSYIYIDRKVDNGITYSYHIIAVDMEGVEQVLNQTPVSATPLSVCPEDYTLRQNYPNPFNPVTEIKYDLPRQTEIHLQIYDVRGALVATLVDGRRPAGSHTVRWNAADWAAGVYFCVLQAGDLRQVRKMVLLK